MDPAKSWTKRNTNNKPSQFSTVSDDRDLKQEMSPRSYASGRRFTGAESNNAPRTNGVAHAAATTSPAASSAFGLGSGAFASFGVSGKTIRSQGSTVDPNRSGTFDVAREEANSPDISQNKQEELGHRSQEQRFQTEDSLLHAHRWPLRKPWVIWYRPPTSKNSDYEKSIKPLFQVSTAQEFWRVFLRLRRPSALPSVSDYHFFKDGVRPVWEDEENRHGGKWILRLKKGVMDRYWEDLLLAAIGDQFVEAGDEVCGVVVSVRSGEDILSIWTKNDGGRNVKIRETIKRVLTLPLDTGIVWKSHDDSIAQRSAIDQARQDKTAGSEKRRNTLSSDSQANISHKTVGF